MDEELLTRIRKEAYEQGYQDGKVDGYNLAGGKQIKRKTGQWNIEKVYEDEYGNEQFNYFCSECGAPAYEFLQPYCHRCGARMDEGAKND